MDDGSNEFRRSAGSGQQGCNPLFAQWSEARANLF